MKAIVVREPGGPGVLEYSEAPEPAPESGQAVVRIEAAGVNFIDVYFRKGLYPLPLPFVPGNEGAGVVTAVAPGVTEVKAGDRVAWAGMSPGAYAQSQALPASRLVLVPEGVGTAEAAAVMLQGMTAHYLSRGVLDLRRGDWALVHAAAGGVGLLLVQCLKRLGARVIGTVSTEEKARLAREAGADETVLYGRGEFAAQVREATAGLGARVAYDSVGRDTFQGSLDSLAPRGLLVLYGQSSGPVPPVDLQVLSAKGSLFVTRPSLGHYTASREELLARAGEVLGWVEDGSLSVRVGARFPLAEAAAAHEALEGRRTTGKVLLIP